MTPTLFSLVVAASAISTPALAGTRVSSKADLASIIATERAVTGSFTARYVTTETVPGAPGGPDESQPQRTWKDVVMVDPSVGFRHEHSWSDLITRPGFTLTGDSIVAFDGVQVFSVSPSDASGVISANCDAMQLRERVPLVFHMMRWYPGLDSAGCDVPADLLSYLSEPSVEMADSIEEVDGHACIRLDRRSKRPNGASILHASVWLDIEHGYLPRLQRRYRMQGEESVVGTEYRVHSYVKIGDSGWIIESAERVIPAASAEERGGWAGRVNGAVQTMKLDTSFGGDALVPFVATPLGQMPSGTTLVDLETGATHVVAAEGEAPTPALAAQPPVQPARSWSALLALLACVTAGGAALLGLSSLRRRSPRHAELFALRRESALLVSVSSSRESDGSALPPSPPSTLGDLVHCASRFKHGGSIGRAGRRAQRHK